MNTKGLADCILLAAGPATAQDSTFSASLYSWVSDLPASAGTRFGEAGSEASGSDARDVLAMAFMGTLEARYGRWGLIGDLLHAKLSADAGSPLDLRFSDADLETNVTAFSGYALYRSYRRRHGVADCKSSRSASTENRGKNGRQRSPDAAARSRLERPDG